MYTLDKDYQEAYTDGSGRYKTIFKKGAVISWETARMLGLVEGDAPEPKPAKAQKEETQKG